LTRKSKCVALPQPEMTGQQHDADRYEGDIGKGDDNSVPFFASPTPQMVAEAEAQLREEPP
jgi:hypothetical protein